MVCIKCLNDLHPENFTFRDKTCSVRRGECKVCKAAYGRSNYVPGSRISNKSTGRKYKADLNKGYRLKCKLRYLKYLSNKICVDCGTTDIRVLQFDHIIPVRDRKDLQVRRVSKLVGSHNKMLQEMDKCVVRCANCHMIKTFQDQGWSREISDLTKKINNTIMPESFSTPGVPTPEESATAQRAKTAALPYENNGTSNPNPRRYDQCVEVPDCDGDTITDGGQVAQGNGPAYE